MVFSYILDYFRAPQSFGIVHSKKKKLKIGARGGSPMAMEPPMALWFFPQPEVRPEVRPCPGGQKGCITEHLFFARQVPGLYCICHYIIVVYLHDIIVIVLVIDIIIHITTLSLL